MVLSFSAIFFLAILIVFAFAISTEEAHAINKIKGYVSEAKEKERQAELAKQNQTEPEEEKIVVDKDGKRCNPNNPICVVEEVVDEIKLLIDPEDPPPREFQRVIGIQLSKTCIQMEKNNVTSNCPTYNDLWQLDNTLSDISGNFTNEGGYYHREKSPYEDSCNFYTQAFPIMLVVDPSGCWQREKGIKMIYVNAIDPEQMIFKLNLDQDQIDDLRDLRDTESDAYDDKNDAENKIDSLEDQIDDLESKIRVLKDDLDKPNCKENNNSGCNTSLQARNFKFQLRFAEESLADKKIDLVAEEIKLEKYIRDLNATRTNKTDIQLTYSSRIMVDGVTSMGVGRYVDNCNSAHVGSDIDLIVDTINYLLYDCAETSWVTVKTTVKEQTPINILDFKEYKFRDWLKDAKERCKVKC